MSVTCNDLPVFAMSGKQSSKLLLRAMLLGSALSLASASSYAQSSDVSVDLSAIDGSAAPAPSTGRVVLRPPAGTPAVSGGSSGRAIKLRPPQAAKKIAKAPVEEPRVESRAEPAAPAPTPEPVKVAAPAPTAAPTPVAAKPTTPPPQAAPTTTAAAPKPTTPAATPAPTAPAPTATAAPSAAAVKSAQQDEAGPAAFTLPDTQQTAAVSKATDAPAAAEEMTTALSVAFAAGVTDIDVASQGSVKDLAKRMSTDKNLRVQLMAYATDPDKNTSRARRLALDRAIAIRNLLIDGGVERTRIEVRALGDQGEGGNLDRVDAVAVKR